MGAITTEYTVSSGAESGVDLGGTARGFVRVVPSADAWGQVRAALGIGLGRPVRKSAAGRQPILNLSVAEMFFSVVALGAVYSWLLSQESGSWFSGVSC